MKNMICFKAFVLATAFVMLGTQPLNAQNKILTIDDIFDTVKRDNING